MSWKKTLKASNNEEVTKNDGESPIAGIQDISSKKCRIEMTKKIFQKPTSEVRLEKAGFTTQEIACIYELPFKLTSDVRLSECFNLKSITTSCTQKACSSEIG